MESFTKEFERLKIRLDEIRLATDDFKTKAIGSGGFGMVYGGELSCFKGRRKVAIKCLSSKHGQGGLEFWDEITILARHTHENLVTLLGFCIEGGKMILVYEYASNGSLDRHLSSPDFTWTRRLKTCLDTARGLSYLHDASGTKERIIHRDIKSSNILLDANWNAKVSDMGLSKIAPANQQHMGNFSDVVGTTGYCDPYYLKTKFLTKESDVYSFGVLLFEVLCGRLCFEKSNGQVKVIVPKWKQSYKQNKLQEIIFDDLKQQMDPTSLKIYSDIAFKCLQESPEERPLMPDVVEELETALQYQELHERLILPEDYKEMLMITEEHPLNNIPETELKMRLFKGTLLNRGKTWFSLNMDGEHCEMISIAECLPSIASEPSASEPWHYVLSSEYNSRFKAGCYEPLGTEFKTNVRTQFLSPQITYTVNLVFKIKKNRKQYIVIEHKLEGEKRTSYAFLSGEREDGWLTAELYQFTSEQRTVGLEIMFYTKYCPNLLVEGIEFRPEKMQPISVKETYWKQKLPEDYEDIIKWSEDGVRWETTKDLYYIFCKGFLINHGEAWFSLDKDGKKCLMLSARAALQESKWKWISVAGTRFEVADYCDLPKFGIFFKFRSELLSPETTYGTYLVYKLPEGYKYVKPPPVQVVDKDSKEVHDIFLRTPQTPVISCNVKNKAFSPCNRPKTKGLPNLRSDGWMEVQVREFQTNTTSKWISTCLKLSGYDMGLIGITVQCLEFRPI
ncbi:hypothetical protein L1987_56000 [Smallanthus sonchifolius]|uniref:Uncharacterized protein n=1 Tax=Smallanthus sonchifolius TaxID=185202 RepID=A0ACB9EB83_9ASTR|nr:hypothetical protein L1987_56000 [Smallanthus sonchifolius]